MNKKLYYVLTLGIGYLIAKKKAKKIANSNNTELKKSTNINIDLNLLIERLGGKNNIIDINSTLNSLIIQLHDTSILNLDDFAIFNPKGLYINVDKLILLMGDNSEAIQNELQNLIK